MTLYNFRPVSKSSLHKIIGLNANYKLIKLPESCLDCKLAAEIQKWSMFPNSIEYKQACEKCGTCPFKKSMLLRTTANNNLKYEYFNEKNKYGSGTPLKRYAILLYLYFHLYAKNKDGIVKNININTIAKDLKCNRKTVLSNIKTLNKHGYIYYSNAYDPQCVNICICNYKSSFLPANKGGRGYYTITNELFNELTSIKTTTVLRVTLKQLLEFDDQSLNKDTIPLKKETKTYKELRRFLPTYCKPCILKKSLTSNNLINFDLEKNTVTISINDKYNAKELKQVRLKEEKENISNICNLIKKESKESTKFRDNRFTLDYFKTKRSVKYVDWNFSDKQITSLVNIAVYYTAELVLSALADIYFTQLCQGIQVKNLGEMVFTIIDSSIKNSPSINCAAV